MAYAAAVLAVQTADVNTGMPGPVSWDGIPSNDTRLLIGTGLLLVGQTNKAQNGVWIWNGPDAALSRPASPAPYAATSSLDNDTLIPVTDGNTYAGTCWGVEPAQTITVDLTPHTLTRVALPPIQVRRATTENIDLSSPGIFVDSTVVTDGAMTPVGSNVLTCGASQPFTRADVGKTIKVSGAGSGAVGDPDLQTTILGYTSPSVVTLTAGCRRIVEQTTVQFGATLNGGDFVLVRAQSQPAENGVYA